MSPVAVSKAELLVTTLLGPDTNCESTHSHRSPTSAHPLSTPPQNLHWLMPSLWEHRALHEFGIAVGDRGERPAKPIQERPQGIGVLLHHILFLPHASDQSVLCLL
jgi:hypothetical protein